MHAKRFSSGPNVEMISPKEATFMRDTFGKLCLRLAGGSTYVGVRPLRTFPLTAPDSCIAVVDSEGREIGLIEEISHLESSSGDILREELALEYFAARICRILQVDSNHGTTTWHVETDRGPRVVHVKDRVDIRTLSPTHLVVTDAGGIKYEIENTRELDARSQALLEGES
jgi:hypothetical protein